MNFLDKNKKILIFKNYNTLQKFYRVIKLQIIKSLFSKEEDENMSINSNDKKAYSEVAKILSEIEEEYIEKIPPKVLETIKNNSLEEYEPNITISMPLTEQNLHQTTFDLLACIYLNYWCENEEEKQMLLKIYSENEKKENEKFEINFSKNKINNDKIEKKDNQLLVIEETNWLKKLFKKFYMFFKSKI